jgi:hypothetical protein
MKRRDFIKNSLFAAAGLAVLGGCKKESKTRAQGGKVLTRRLLGLSAPLLSMGCMRLPTAGGQIDAAEVERMVDYAITHGVNYFDTAYMYHGGNSETAIGNALSN